MVRSLPLVAALAGSAMAAEKTTTLSLIVPSNASLVGSVINADSSATTVAVQCAPGTHSDECGLVMDVITVTQGEKTWELDCTWALDENLVFTQTANCTLDPSNDIATCGFKMTQNSTLTTSAGIESGYKASMHPVTITAGVDKLSASPGASATNGGNKTSSAGEATKTGAAAATSTTGKNAGPAVTQNVVLAGVAAIVGGVLAM